MYGINTLYMNLQKNCSINLNTGQIRHATNTCPRHRPKYNSTQRISQITSRQPDHYHFRRFYIHDGRTRGEITIQLQLNPAICSLHICRYIVFIHMAWEILLRCSSGHLQESQSGGFPIKPVIINQEELTLPLMQEVKHAAATT